MNDDIYRKKSISATQMDRNEDSDHYGYTDSNSPSTPGIAIAFRKKKTKKPKIKRKPTKRK